MLTVTLASAATAGVVTTSGSHVITIPQNTMAAHEFSFTSPASAIAEGGMATYSVARTGPAITDSITVSWGYSAPADGGASAADFAGDSVPAGGELVFTGTDAMQTFTVATQQDELNEADEEFTLTITAAPTVLAAEGGVALPRPLAVAITDDDAITATLSGGGTVNEGDDIDVTVTLSGGELTADVVLNYTLTGEGITAADVIDGGAGRFTIRVDDEAPHTFRMVAVDDALNEAHETLTVGGTATSAGTVTVASPQEFIITDADDITVTIAADTATVVEGQTAAFTVTLSAASGQPVTVTYTLGGSATAADYTAPESLQATVAVGQPSAQFGIPVVRDTLLSEGAETLSVTIATAARGVTVAGNARATVAISDFNLPRRDRHAGRHGDAPRHGCGIQHARLRVGANHGRG